MNKVTETHTPDSLITTVFKHYYNEIQQTIGLNTDSVHSLSAITLIEIPSQSWGVCAKIARKHAIRWAGIWADEINDQFNVHVCLEYQGRYLLLRTRINADRPELASHAVDYPGADRPERHLQDMYGICFTDQPSPHKRWTRHQAWDDKTFPLRNAFPVSGFVQGQSPADMHYPFLKASGASVYEIPVGPIHAGIIEPGHFRFIAIGETVLHLEERLGYVHKGIEKIAVGRDPTTLVRLAGRVSGDTTVAHSWAACKAMESAAKVQCPARADYLRAILAERERIINHLGDMGALCNDVGFAFGYYQFTRLRENWIRENQRLFGHRLMMDCIIPGGVNIDLDTEGAAACSHSLNTLQQELKELIIIIDANSSLEDRFLGTGILSPQQATTIGALGYVGRASGQGFDVRQTPGYFPYNQLQMTVPVETDGDVAARFWLRYKELRVAKRLLEQLLHKLPPGPLSTPWRQPPANAEGFAAIEGWRGEILCYIRFGNDNRIARYYPRDPSQINWPALEKIQINNIVPDFPVCNKSVNGSYSGQDL